MRSAREEHTVKQYIASLVAPKRNAITYRCANVIATVCRGAYTPRAKLSASERITAIIGSWIVYLVNGRNEKRHTNPAEPLVLLLRLYTFWFTVPGLSRSTLCLPNFPTFLTSIRYETFATKSVCDELYLLLIWLPRLKLSGKCGINKNCDDFRCFTLIRRKTTLFMEWSNKKGSASQI